MTGAPEQNKTPCHVAIIMDGNGRWARQRGLPRLRGHSEGVKSVEAVTRACREAGVKFLTLYAFSTENWSRDKAEISGLMRLLTDFLRHNMANLRENQIRLRMIGRMADLPRAVQEILKAAIRDTAEYTAGQLILALSYGARDEITAAARAIAKHAAEGRITPESVDEAMLSANLYAPDVPYPDLLIRTSGELRLSNFLLWQLSYAELYFTNTLWPDFREPEFHAALKEYSLRKRRFGGLKPEKSNRDGEA